MPRTKEIGFQGLTGRVFGVAVGLAAMLPAPDATAETIAPGVQDFEFGFFCATEPLSQRPASGTISGVVNNVDGSPRFVRLGPMVPARLGIGFGVNAQVLPQYEGPVLAVTLHPPMGPNRVTRETFDANLSSAEPSYLGFSFEHAYELVPGPWTLSAEANGRVIYSVDFLVVDPKSMPDVTCGEAVPLS
jgi:hypothetical protein